MLRVGQTRRFIRLNPSLVAPSFSLPLQSSLTPSFALGSATASFSRASAAEHIDFEGIHRQTVSGAFRPQGARYVRNTIVTNSELFSGWTTFAACTVTDGEVDPQGGTRASKFVTTAVASSGKFRAIAAGPNTNRPSLWLRGAVGGEQVAFGNNLSQTTVTLTTAWKRYSSSAPIITAGNESFVILNANVSVITFYAAWSMSEVVDGQTNQLPSEYVPVLATANADSGAIGVRYFPYLNGNTVASNVVIEAAGAPITSARAEAAGGVTAGVVDASGPLGYLAEGSRTNLALQSQTFATSPWTAGANNTITADQVIAPDGTTTADVIVESDTNVNFHYTSQAFVKAASAIQYTFSVYMKAGVRTWGLVTIYDGTDGNRLYVNLATGANGANTVIGAGFTGISRVTVPVANGFWRFIITFTTPATTALTVFPTSATADSTGNYAGVATTQAIALWGAQLEAASFASSYKPTTTVAVTQAADVDQGVSAGNLPSTHSGTMQITPVQAMGSATVFHFGTYVDANNYSAVLSDGTNLIARKRIGGSNHEATIAWARAAGTVAKVGWRFDTTNGADIWLNGVKGTGDSTLTAAQIGTNFQIGADGNSLQQDFCEHRLLNLYPASVSSARMGALTT